jgi:spectinomycin phosphotransferase
LKALPEEFDAGGLTGFLADGWGFEVETADYAPLGAGSYHWEAGDREGTRRFVTVDDLDQKPWLGDTRDSVFDGLRRAFDTAAALRDAGLGFVVSPIPTRRGETVLRIGPRHTIALFPFLVEQAGQPSQGPFPHYDTADERAAVITMLAELHEATPAGESIARRIELDLPGRSQLESALQELDGTWTGGPLAEPARRSLARHVSCVTELLALADRLRDDLARRGTSWVVTHGEPHARNVLRTAGSPSRVLVDWDTAALAPPERDLWMLVGDDTAGEATIYAEATGHRPDPVAADFFRLAWDLGDLAAYLSVLRAPHRRSEDAVNAYRRLTEIVAGRSS